MRYLGNKSNLLSFIEGVMNKYNVKGEVFADIFAGTCSVGDHFKHAYKIIANDYMYFSSVISSAKLLNNSKPEFKCFFNKYKVDIFDYLNELQFIPDDSFFIYKNYSPVGNRMFFTERNAIKIDGIRQKIEKMSEEKIISTNEYYYLLASLLESTLRVSNTTGTYQAYLKFWESRSNKEFVLEGMDIETVESIKENEVFNLNANELVKTISGDIVYIDTPYTITQYANSYHVLETIAKYDNPIIFGKTGRRKQRELSGYSNKTKAIREFEDLFRKLDFEHVLISYSDQSIIPIAELTELAAKFAIDGKVNIEESTYREYATNNLSQKGNGKCLHETLIYFRKDRKINKSPLNYSGSKDNIVKKLNMEMPKHIGTFFDVMGGAFNVGANVVATDNVIYNEYNYPIYEVVKMLLEQDKQEIVNKVKNNVYSFGLKKKDSEAYKTFRDYYNSHQNPINLFTLQIYAFQNIIRYNSKHKFNTPVGNNEFNSGTESRILNFYPKTKKVSFMNKDYLEIDYLSFPKDTLFYFDPPYFITKAEYNDGKRGDIEWSENHEKQLLELLNRLNDNGYKFMLSNVVLHNGKEHRMLIDWVKENDYRIVSIGETGIKYPRREVAVVNYKEEDEWKEY